MLVDTHAHLFWESFQEDFEEVIERALDAGVTDIINIGVDVETSNKAASLKSSQIKFYSSIGIHPHEAAKYSTDVSIHKDIEKLEKLYHSDQPFDSAQGRIIAVGECGLDFLFANNPWSPPYSGTKPDLTSTQIKDLQKKLFQAQIDLAKKLNLPLLIHCRDDRSKNLENTECWDEVIAMTKDHFGIYHCYSGLPQTTTKILKTTQFLISFAGNLTYPKNEYLRQAAKEVPLDRTMVETDCPFLPPQSHRGKRNEPSFIIETVKTLAQIKGVSEQEVAKQTSENLTKISKLTI